MQINSYNIAFQKLQFHKQSLFYNVSSFKSLNASKARVFSTAKTAAKINEEKSPRVWTPTLQKAMLVNEYPLNFSRQPVNGI